MPFPLRPEQYGTYLWLLREVGAALGYGNDRGTWKHAEVGIADTVVQRGLMQFYFPPPLGDQGVPHRWSFLSPIGTIAIESGVQAYALPEDFTGVIGEFTFTAGETTQRVPLVPEVQLRQLYASAPRSGTPAYAAVRPKASDGSAAQGYEVLFYPTPDSGLTLEYRYHVTPPVLTEDRPHPLGGRQYAEAILASCLAVAEERAGGGEGFAASRFQSRLAAAIQYDNQSLQPTDDSLWPLENPPSGLAVNKAYLKRLVGREMGYGPHSGTWTHKQGQEIEVVVQTGLRKFYRPPVLPGERYGHEWSFLCPVATLTLVDGEHRYDLPDDFALMVGPMTFAPGAAVLYPPVRIVGEHQIRQRLQRTEASARPEMAAIRVRQPDGSVGTRYEILLWPVPDQEYDLTYRYQISPDSLDDDTALPLGGQSHMQTVIEACLAAVEETQGQPGIHSAAFLVQLAVSIGHDRKVNSADTLGYNVDPSDRAADRFASWHDMDDNLVTYTGYDPD